MKRRNSKQRFLTILLAFSMLSQQTSIVTLAEEINVSAEAELQAEAPQQEPPVQTEAPQPEAPAQTEAPKQEAPAQAEAPKQEAPAQPEAPKQEAPAQTEAPKQEAPAQTEAPKQEAPAQTEAPKQEAPAQPEVSKPEAPKPEVPAQTEASHTEAPAGTEAPQPELPAETSKPEVPQTETSAQTETLQPETPAQTGPSTETEIPVEAETETQTENPEQTGEQTEGLTEVETEAETETEAWTEPVTESATEAVTEFETETETESETETETESEEAELHAEVKQEAFRDADGALAVKYTITVTNSTADADAEDLAVKAVLGKNSLYYSREGQSGNLNYIENISQIPGGMDLNELKDYPADQLASYTSAVVWQNQEIAGGGKNEYIFFTQIGEEAQSAADVQAMFFVDGARVGDEKIQWTGAELIQPETEAQPQSYTYEDDRVVISVNIPEGVVLPDGTEFHAAYLPADSEAYAAAMAAIAAADETKEAIAGEAYDLSFLAGEEEKTPVAPEGGAVQVSMNFSQGILAPAAKTAAGTAEENAEAAESADEIKLFHIADGAAVEVAADIRRNADGTVSAVTFEAESFSPYVVVRLAEKAVDRTFTYEDDQVIITVDVPKEVILPQDAELVVRPIEEDTSDYEDASAKTEKEVEGVVLKHLIYDIGFEAGGKKVEPEGGNVQVKFEFVEAAFKELAEKIEDSDVKVLHIDSEDKISDVTDEVNTTKDGAVESLGFTTDSFSAYDIMLLDVSDHTTTNTFTNDPAAPGASYTLEYVMANYVAFTRNDMKANHIAGTVIIGGELIGCTGLGGASYIPYHLPQKAPGYVKSGLIPGGTVNTCNPKMPFYIGSGVTNKELALAGSLHNGIPGDVYYDWYRTDNYVDFDGAMKAFHDQAAALEGTTHITADKISGGAFSIDSGTYFKDGIMYLTLGRSYDFDTFDGIKQLYFLGNALDAINTVITNKCNLSTVNMPQTAFENAPPVNSEVTDGTGIVFLFPEATSVNTGNDSVGHIVAPNAHVEIPSGNYNGCIIADSLTTAAEIHTWPYNAGHITTGEAQVAIRKTVNGEAPGNETFEFQMKKIQGPDGNDGTAQGESAVKVTGHNTASGEITFEAITDYQVAGDYIYEITEISQKSGYEPNTQKFYAKITVTTVADGNNTIHTAAKPVYYKDSACTTPVVGTATFNNVTATVDIEGSKTWKDANNQDGKRPGSITIHLFADGQEVGSKTVTAKDNWRWKFADKPKYAAGGTEIVYTITEDAVDGYQSEINGYNVTNSYTPGKVSVPVTKIWQDGSNQDGIRPNSVTVKLLADGADSGKTLVLNAGNNWSGSFDDLDEYRNGKKIAYTVEEITVTGYSSKIAGNANAGYTVTNSHTPETVDIEGSKTWEDADNQDGKRPGSLTIHLLADGKRVDSKTVTKEDNWSWQFTGKPKYKAGGARIVYTIAENGIEGYQSVINGYNVTNKYTPGKVNVPVTKSWQDGNNQDGIRPASVTVKLLADGADSGKTLVLNAGNKWSGSFSDLDKYKAGNKIVYTIEEVKVDGYDSVITGNAKDGYMVANTHTPETVDIEGSKTWEDADNQDGKRPGSLTVNLLADGQKVDSRTVTEKENWSWQFTGKPKYKAGGTLIVYTIAEEAVDGYQSRVNGYDITNSYTPGKVNVPVTKSWQDSSDQDGIRPDSVTVHLLADGVDSGETLVLNAENNWSGSFDDLDEYSDNQKIAYTVEEDAVDGYVSVITGDADNGYVITNSHTPELVTIEGSKIWDDADNQDGKRPESITVNLLADGQKVDSKTVTEEENWSWQFTARPKYKAGGVLIDYTITEDAVDGYVSAIAGDTEKGYVITNSHTPETTGKTVTKVWEDMDNRDQWRPADLKVQLFADGKPYGDAVTLSENNKWTYTWEELPKYENGQEIVYTADETGELSEYQKEIQTAEDGSVIITNTVKTGSLTIRKIVSAPEGSVPAQKESFDVVLRDASGSTYNADGQKEEGAVIAVPADGNGITVSGLRLGVYTVEEVEADAQVDGFDLTITYQTGEEGAQSITFNGSHTEDTIMIKNTYVKREVAESALASIQGLKTLTGRTLKEGEFGFSLEAEEGAPLPKETRITNTADGRFAFGPIEYQEAGTYAYKVSEVSNKEDKATAYDETVYAFTVKVADEDGDNKLEAVVNYPDGREAFEFTNKNRSVKVRKVDAVDENELEGAHIQVLDGAGVVVDDWISTKEAHEVAGLEAGVTYTLREVTAPVGYTITNDTTFVLNEDGTVSDKTTTAVGENSVLLVKDTMVTSEKATIKVTKTLTYNGGPIHAVDQTFYVALYYDEACTRPASEVKAVRFRNSSSETVEFTNLEIGRTYYVGESDANGTNLLTGALADGSVFIANFSGGNKAVLKSADETAAVSFENQFMTLPDGFYKAGELTITKKLIDADGVEMNSDETFYAGIFADKDYTVLSEQVSENIVALDLAGASQAEASVEVSFGVGERIRLYVTEVDADGKPVAGAEGFEYEVSVDNTTVTLDENNTSASVTITNKEVEEEIETETEEVTEKGRNTSVKTGDETPIAPFAVAFGGSALLIMALAKMKRRRNKKA